ncbi:molybdopterin-guanine dinucleotide biosynthesis protein B [Granulosicoccaceae sp. 1_MG-2023]|nr:molybdopterin-guanine dinucleotide biosynthesis protein B [Granulosicoccaceae sp. 1_MG-2023]
MKYAGVPVLGFVAWSGSGKTTLLSKVLPLLVQSGVRVALIKHAHHHFDIDHPGKDSYRLREAGASQVVVASRHRLALIRELPDPADEPSLDDALGALQTDALDLILVEGYKHESFSKIEVSRKATGKPLLYPDDPDIIAVICDEPGRIKDAPTVLDIDKPDTIAGYLTQWLQAQAEL